MAQGHGREVRVQVQDIEGLSASAMVDHVGTVWVVVGEDEPDPHEAALEAIALALSLAPDLPAEGCLICGGAASPPAPRRSHPLPRPRPPAAYDRTYRSSL